MFLDQIVVGSCLESALYAFSKDSYYLPNKNFGPAFYERCPKILGKSQASYTWSRILLLLSLQGKLLSYDKKKIFIAENELKILDAPSSPIKYNFQVCEVFDSTEIVLQNEIVKAAEAIYKVFDDFELSNLGSKNRFIEPKDCPLEPIASKIVFYNSGRVLGSDYVTDCVVESYMTREQRRDINYSDSIIRFYVSRYLEEVGVHGNFMNLYKSGKPKYRKPKITHKARLSFMVDQNKYADSKSIKFIYNKKEALGDLSAPWS